jgi:parallel beta-helix repeat protein
LANGIVLSGNYLNVSGFDVSGAVSHAILISGTNITFENSSVHNSVTENGSGTCSGTGSWGSAVKLMIGSQNTLIRNNSVYENCGEGIGITRSLNAKVEGNTVRDNFSVNIYIDNSPYSSAIGNNVLCTGIYLRNGRRMTGIAIAEESYSGWGAQRHDNSVINNVVDGCYQGIVSWVPEVTGGEFINGTIIGNTVINGTNGSIVIRSVNQNVTISDNTVYTAIDVSNMAGVTLSNNTISNLPPTSTHSPSPIPSRTPSPIPTKSPSPTPSPTKTPTPVPTKSPSPSPLSITGDVNVDGAVDILDVGIVIDNYEKNPIVYSRADINGDGVVNLTDIGIILTNYGR